MRNTGLYVLGALFIGLGFGWLIFNTIGVTGVSIAWLLMGIGAVIVASTLLSWRLYLNTAGIITAFSVGLVISLVLVAGIPIFSGVGPVVKERAYKFDGAASADNLSFEFTNVNGVVRVSTWNRESYNISMVARVRGWSDGENTETLGQVSVSVSRQVEGGKLRLVLVVSVPSTIWSKLDVNVNASLPVRSITDLALRTTNGDISVMGINGGNLDIETTNGRIHFEGTNASTVRCTNTNGVIYGVVEAGDLSASCVNGGLDFRIPSRMSGTYRLNLVNGNINVAVKVYPDNGFFADLSAVNGRVTVDLQNFLYTTDNVKHKIGETAGFASRTVKIEIKAETVNGNSKVSVDTVQQ